MNSLAALKGTKIRYFDVPLNDVMLERQDGECIIIRYDTFNHLYFKLNDHEAALKDDCIEYTAYNIYKPLDDYPEWYVQAVYQGLIVKEGSTHTFIDAVDGEVVMSPEAILLRNFRGELRYMERRTFNMIYDLN